LARDLGLSDCDELLNAIHATDEEPSDHDPEETSPNSPSDIPLSQAGSLFLLVCFVFSSVLLSTEAPLPKISIFPDHAKLVGQFIGTDGPVSIGSEKTSIIDAILFLGLWLEHNNAFVSGPLSDEDYLQHLQNLSLISANCPSPSLRYHAHLLTSSILHAHPVDRTRLTFISDTLEHCPYENLKVSAVSWLKEELIAAKQRKSENIFSSTVALAAAQPYLFPDLGPLAAADANEQWEEMQQSFPFHMAVVNFLYFLGAASEYANVVPTGMRSVVEEIYLGPLRKVQIILVRELGEDGTLIKKIGALEDGVGRVEVELLGQRLDMVLE
jgi:hypothetical protein